MCNIVFFLLISALLLVLLLQKFGISSHAILHSVKHLLKIEALAKLSIYATVRAGKAPKSNDKKKLKTQLVGFVQCG